jgi:hypothetical protein
MATQTPTIPAPSTIVSVNFELASVALGGLGLRREIRECQGLVSFQDQRRGMSAETSFVTAISAATESRSCWQALEKLADALVGARLFTVTIVDEPAALVRRAYSNSPAEYPTSGTKPLHGKTGDWFETVFVKRETFVANTIGAIAKVFPDHELIASLGCGSAMNLPIVLEGNLVATVNLLDETGRYTPERVAIAEERLAIAARLCCALALRFDGMAKDEAA